MFKGAKVIIASRDQTERLDVDKFETWIKDIEFIYLDLTSFSDIREFSHIIHYRKLIL